MISYPPPKKRSRRLPKPTATAQPVPTLNLVSATISGVLLSLQFDQPISVNTYVPGNITVRNGYTEQLLIDTGVDEMSGPNTIVLAMQVIGEYLDRDTLLDATNLTGIAIDGTEIDWAGVTDFQL
jgi:hypothetical protein